MFHFLVCLFIGLPALYIFLKRRLRNGNIIQGPRGLPLIGCILEVKAENIHHKFFEYAEKFGDIFQLKLLSDNVIVLNTEQMIRTAFGDGTYKHYLNDRPSLFFGEHFRCGNQSIGMMSDRVGHQIARKVYSKALHAYGSGLQEVENNVMTEMALLVKRIENMHGKEFGCSEVFRRSLSNIVSLVMSGDVINDDDPDVNMMWEQVHGADFFANSKIDIIMKKMPFLRYLPGQLKTEYEKCNSVHKKILKRYFYDIKRTHVDGELRGIVDYYLEIQKKEEASGNGVFFTDDRIIAQVVETIDAGIATTWAFLTNSLLILCNFPKYQTKIQAELDHVIGRNRLPKYTDREKCVFLKAFGMEVHRYCTIVPLLLPHFCRKQIEFEGYIVTPNSLVFANVWYIHHNEKIWGDPWTFRPERFLDESGNILPNDHKLMKNYLPFGYGPRQCPGSVFAKTRYFLYFATLLQRWTFEFSEGKEYGCDPRNPDHFDMGLILKAKSFLCCARERM